MFEYISKAVASAFIWLAVLGIALATILNSATVEDWVIAAVVIVPVVVGMIATGAIWSPEMFTDGDSSEQSSTKAKRGSNQSKYDLLLELMDDDERAAFKDALRRQALSDMRVNDDGELPESASMLWEDRR